MISELTNATRKAIASLSTPKGRREHGWFLAQGEKCVSDTIGYFQLVGLFANSQMYQTFKDKVGIEPLVVKNSDLERMSSLSTAPSVIAVYEIPVYDDAALNPKSLYLALDRVQDPGNLGTIMRIADWMGVNRIFASADCADVWNPKVIQSTMGAISRVKVEYKENLSVFLQNANMPIYGTFLNGENIYRCALTPGGIVVMGNEGHGISKDVAQTVTQRLFIPSYPPDEPTSESLNVASATAITLSEFRRRLEK